MMASTTTSSGVSGSIFNGIPDVAIHYFRYAKKFQKALDQAINETVSRYDKELKRQAVAAWGEAGSQVAVGFDPNSMMVTFNMPEDLKPYEYGDMDNPPHPVLRTFMAEAAHDIPRQIELRLKELLG